ncbi:lysophospholipase L1-like esterase [Allocatelliglobosispora scoriae]|uniref:Lysophospholipase L1-like esterase n=1 Tax=Allocatelliglobosispora scoriae TaxID=643052 RepID=A0A841BLG5_9ACTN|nr:SGNH/GDSL hydrolase family protein [Allocatelliglobosispora scoriae]MBB5868096.1 lysophospholipase L1-like esterase [Allocatelliglobosispora scoriae]
MRPQRTAAYASALIVAVCLAIGFGSPASAAAAVNYVALGDSYSSGVGAGNYIPSSGSCNRSPNAYPALWAAAHSTATYSSVACSGATTASLISSQVPALSATTTLVSVTIGGNDAGFSNIMSTCALQGTDQCVAAVNAAETFARNTLPGRLDSAYTAIRGKAPSARVVVLGYPVFYQLGTVCVGLSATSRAKINEGINLVDDITKAAAQRHGFTFADVRSQFVGHQLCSYGTKWLHALNFADLGVSYHPTAAGQSGGYLPVFNGSAA